MLDILVSLPTTERISKFIELEKKVHWTVFKYQIAIGLDWIELGEIENKLQLSAEMDFFWGK